MTNQVHKTSQFKSQDELRAWMLSEFHGVRLNVLRFYFTELRLWKNIPYQLKIVLACYLEEKWLRLKILWNY